MTPITIEAHAPAEQMPEPKRDPIPLAGGGEVDLADWRLP